MATTPTHVRAAADHPTRHPDRTPRAFVLLGVGLGGFIDGIVLHQILQWHHLLSATDRHDERTVSGLEANTLADGAFHVFAFACTLVGILALRRMAGAGHDVGARRVMGWMLVGWGAFNLVEGVVNHHLLRLHHVRDDVDERLPWDVGFLVLSVALVALGLGLARHDSRRGSGA